MNVKECANCRLHGWKQLTNKDDLLTCKKCKVIKYCGKDCQMEHWKKHHKRQCKYFADPSKAQQTEHNEDTCVLCLHTTSVGKSEIRNPNCPNYECFYMSPEWEKIVVSDLYHDHPFSVTGQPGNVKEKVSIVTWNLVYKFQHSQPTVFQKFRVELKEILHDLLMQRLDIWQNRKIYPQPEYFPHDDDTVIIDPDVSRTIGRSISLADPFELWKIIDVVHQIGVDEGIKRTLNSFKDPLATMPLDLRNLVSMALKNTAKFTAMAHQVLEALAYQVIPYQVILKIICGGSLKQTCCFCSKEIFITGIGSVDLNSSVVFCDNLFIGMYVCGVGDCRARKKSMREDVVKLGFTVLAAVLEREVTRCDFCFLLSPVDDAHRCSRCFTTMYCSKTCQLEDWKLHKEVCKEEQEERKIKSGMLERREAAREAREEFKEPVGGNSRANEACEMLKEFEFKKAQKESKKKTK